MYISGSQRTVLIQKGEGIADKIVTGFLCTIPEMKEKLEGGNIMINLGTLKEITDLRSIWPHEALNFTPWVAENVELLADAVGLDITVDETESSVGNFNVDIYAWRVFLELNICRRLKREIFCLLRIR